MPTLHERLHAKFVRTGADLRTTEKDIAGALVVYSFISLIAIMIDPTEPVRFAGIAYGLLISYVIYSLGLLLYISRAKNIDHRTQVVNHLLNIAWSTAISLFTSGPNSAFFIFFVFVIFSAAYRWHFRQTLATTITLMLVLVGQAYLLRLGPHQLSDSALYDTNRLIMRSVYLLMIGGLAGYVAERLKQATAELALLTRFNADVTSDISLKRTMTVVARHLRSIFGTDQVVLSFRESANGDIFVVDFPTMASVATWRKASPSEQQCLFFPGQFRIAALTRGNDSKFILEDSVEISSAEQGPPELWESFHCSSLLLMHLALAKEWEIRVFIPNPVDDNSAVLRLLDMVGAQLQPALSNVYLLRRIRNQATAMERARIARDLHDGSIQSLVSLEMQMAMLAGSDRTPGWLAEELHRLKDVVRGEVLSLREMMERMHPVNVNARNLIQSLSDVVEDFRRRTAINIHFVSEAERVNLRPRVCQELISILREALVNVRKHSGANTVVVRLACEADIWRLQIDDDGRGFDFTGDMSLNDLDRERRGPVVIKERVRVIGGQLRIQSIPGKGSQVEVTVQPTHD